MSEADIGPKVQALTDAMDALRATCGELARLLRAADPGRADLDRLATRAAEQYGRFAAAGREAGGAVASGAETCPESFPARLLAFQEYVQAVTAEAAERNAHG